MNSALVLVDCSGRSEWVADAIRATVSDTQAEIVYTEQDEAMTKRALELLNSRRNDVYEVGRRCATTHKSGGRTSWREIIDLNPLMSDSVAAEPKFTSTPIPTPDQLGI